MTVVSDPKINANSGRAIAFWSKTAFPFLGDVRWVSRIMVLHEKSCFLLGILKFKTTVV